MGYVLNILLASEGRIHANAVIFREWLYHEKIRVNHFSELLCFLKFPKILLHEFVAVHISASSLNTGKCNRSTPRTWFKGGHPFVQVGKFNQPRHDSRR